MNMTFETLLLEIQDGVATLTFNRPEVMNAISQRMKDELGAALDAIDANDNVRVLLITGAGRAFCAGADIKERSATEPSPVEFIRRQQQTHRLFTRIEQSLKPVIAAINGVALGGGAEIALCADLRIMSDSASIGLTEVNLGVIPAGGGTVRLPRLVGVAKAKELLFTGKRLGASDALSIGLVNEIVPAQDQAKRSWELAKSIAEKAPLSVRFAKQAVERAVASDLETALAFELYAAAILFDTQDRKEGMRAFAEKRAPVFRGC